MAQEATANEQKKFKVPRIPGDIMIYPMIVGLLLNTFCPQVFEIGGFFTAACRGGSNTIVAAILLFVGPASALSPRRALSRPASSC